ncbi:hypothetical protein OUZ56_003199 [Daphnia magna]|uniref:Uncharacterized protein n=1 Tax=Daphnia magna TaxID=35525 RepID=A0ABR0A8G8_9CRUS|nr:hypothetical protein OUZ56_003199 [Daphnia magna]
MPSISTKVKTHVYSIEYNWKREESSQAGAPPSGVPKKESPCYLCSRSEVEFKLVSGNIAGFIFAIVRNYYCSFLDDTQLGHRTMINSSFISYKSRSRNSVLSRGRNYLGGPSSPEMVSNYLSVSPSFAGGWAGLVDYIDRDARVSSGQKKMIRR